jgi:hypothetical protein
MKYRHIGYIFIIGMILFIPGVLFTFINWPFSSEMLIAGTIIKLAAAILFFSRMISERNKKRIIDK